MFIHEAGRSRACREEADPQDELMGLYRALQYLEQKAQLLGLRLVSAVIGAAAMGTKMEIEERRLDS